MYLSVCLSVSLSVALLVCLSIYLSIYVFYRSVFYEQPISSFKSSICNIEHYDLLQTILDKFIVHDFDFFFDFLCDGGIPK